MIYPSKKISNLQNTCQIPGMHFYGVSRLSIETTLHFMQ